MKKLLEWMGLIKPVTPTVCELMNRYPWMDADDASKAVNYFYSVKSK